MTRITYVPSLLFLATRMCRLIARATPVIVILYPDSTAVHAALSAANAACQELQIQLTTIRDFGD